MSHLFLNVFYQVCQAGKVSRQKKEEKLGTGYMCMVSDCLGIYHQVLGRLSFASIVHVYCRNVHKRERDTHLLYIFNEMCYLVMDVLQERESRPPHHFHNGGVVIPM